MATCMREYIRWHLHPVVLVDGNRPLGDTVTRMKQQRAPAAVVTENDNPVGMFSGRELLCAIDSGSTAALMEAPVGEFAARLVIRVAPDDSVGDVIAAMAKSDVLHALLEDGGRIDGVVLRHELAEYHLSELSEELDHLNRYIFDLHDAALD